jgi:cysteine-rich repeat protein
VCDCGDGLPNQFEECDSGAAGCDVVGGEVCGVPTSRRGCFCIATCGNGQINVGEDCETGLPGADCRSRGYAGGEGACVDCAFDEAACNSGRCGDGIIASKAGEACEATDLAGETCESLGFTRGTLRCAPDCLRYDVSGCVRGFCGDGTLDPGEQCDAGVANRNVANAPCREDCRLPRCGDGIVDDQRAEECDDGNRSDADPCLNSCEVATCGDGILCTARACVTGPNRGPEQCEFNSACCESACAVRTCDDGLLCGDRGNNVCCHPDRACDDGNPCTKDLCEDFVGCQHTPIANCCAADRDCDDGNVCTDDTCDEPAVTCVFTPNTSACNDGSVCTSDDGCSGGVCGGTPVGCVSPEVCLAPIGCHPGDGCQFGRIAGCCEVDGDCNDGDACTSDTCDPATNRCRTSQVACESADACFVVSGCDQALGCLLARRRGFAALDCLIGLEIARLDEAVRGNLTALGPKLTNQLAKFSTKGRKKLDKAIDLAGKAPKALKQVRGGRTLFGKFSKVLAQQADKGKVNRALADDLLSRVNVIDAEIGIVAADLGG